MRLPRPKPASNQMQGGTAGIHPPHGAVPGLRGALQHDPGSPWSFIRVLNKLHIWSHGCALGVVVCFRPRADPEVGIADDPFQRRRLANVAASPDAGCPSGDVESSMGNCVGRAAAGSSSTSHWLAYPHNHPEQCDAPQISAGPYPSLAIRAFPSFLMPPRYRGGQESPAIVAKVIRRATAPKD